MKKLAIAALTALAIPATALAADSTPSPKSAAKSACKTMRSDMGKKTFKQTFRSAGLGKCVSAQTKAEKANQSNAAKDCKAERDDATFADSHDGKTFEQFYGTNKNGKNAYGKCVSGKAKAASADDVDATVNAAKTCKQAREDDADAFAAEYGSKRNAFGKCVSRTAKADQS